MLQKLYSWYGKRAVWTVAVTFIALSVVGVAIKQHQSEPVEAQTVIPTLAVASVSELSGQSTLSLIGTVESVSEADIKAEVAGRVTSVSVNLGQEIKAGQVIATLENARERAAVLQAQGAYEAALASASVSDISSQQAANQLTAAESTAVNAVQNAYSTVSSAYFTTIDDFYSNPTSPLTYPLLSNGNRNYLSSERVAFQDILPAWQAKSSVLASRNEIYAAINASISYTSRTRALVDSFLLSLQERSADTFNGESVSTQISTLTTLRSSLESTISSLNSAKTSLQNAEQAYEQAQIAGTQTEVSAANAQVKQALGVLQSAQASLGKTILRSPIAGTVNSLNVKLGDFLSVLSSVAKVANNNALEVTVFVGEADRQALEIGSEVSIDGKYQGVVTHIGAGIDPQTQKTEVKIATETTELTNGDTVSVTVSGQTESKSSTTLFIPITAIKFTADAGAVYTIENNILVEHPVTIGQIRGANVEVADGITPEMLIVTDARGLTAGAQAQIQE